MSREAKGQRWQEVVKRVLDVALALLLLVLLAPLLVLVAVLIKLDSRGTILFVQERLGRGLRPFRMYKFRSMVENASELQVHIRDLNEVSLPLFKVRRDPRLTRIGRPLRRLSIDELPQLLNVLKGDMSLVGPRPPLASEVAMDPFRQACRLRRLPGLTGAWQVRGRSEVGYEEMMDLDLDYVANWSLGRDLRILLRTPGAVITGRGAH
jgi:lipopolysaccharide/colanic/teichoic acid biosynthesis glycosyltransferase